MHVHAVSWVCCRDGNDIFFAVQAVERRLDLGGLM